MNFKDQNYFMSLAIEMAQRAEKLDEVPIGAVVVDPFGKVLAKAHNLKERDHNPTGHAELLAVTEACKQIKNWRLEKCSIFVTLEPCPMCLSLMQQSRISNLYFGAYDSKGGAISRDYHLHKDSSLNHQFSVLGGLNHFECSRLLSNFFKSKRSFYNKKGASFSSSS